MSPCHPDQSDFLPVDQSVFLPSPFLRVPLPPCWESRGRKSSPLLGSPVTPWSICSTPFSSEGWGYTGQFGESVQVTNHTDFSWSLSAKAWSQTMYFLQTARNKSSYILSPHKNKWHAPSRSLYFKPSQPTSDLADLGSSCSNSALQAHSYCARQRQQTFCSFSSSIFFQKQTLQRRVHCLLCWKGYILI